MLPRPLQNLYEMMDGVLPLALAVTTIRTVYEFEQEDWIIRFGGESVTQSLRTTRF